ncbi:MAG: hypothetical protein FJ088_08425, partial [Deltaproteobacteria bacterium]|nr:hypothetical protein [Deltaproteobacteria bacterium]
YVCDDGKWCTLDKCLGDGNCGAAELVEKSCLINGVCYLKGEENPANMCEWCQPENNKTAWSPRPDNAPCTDKNECTVNDKCLSGVCKPGNPMFCEDYNPCTENKCDPQTGCVYPGNDIYREDFDNGFDFTFQNSDPVVGWDVVNDQSGWYGSRFLYYGDMDAISYDTPGTANSGVALSNTMISIDPQSEAYLSFDLYLSNEWSNYFATGGDGRWNYDYLEAVLYLEDNSEVVVWSSNWWAGEYYWIYYQWSIPAKPKLLRISGIDLPASLSHYGNDIPDFQLGFRFNTIDEQFNTFEGVLIDNVVIGNTCSDNEACTQGESCQNGACKGLEKVCDDADDCTIQECDPQNGCMYTYTQGGNSCNDYDLCTENTVCDNMGYCGGGNAVTCPDDNNDCTTDACDPLAGCSYEPAPDFTACSEADPYGTCLGGKCVPWEMSGSFIGDLDTLFFAIDRSPDDGGELYVAGSADKPDGNPDDPATQTNFLIDTGSLTVEDIFQNPDYTDGIFFDVSGRLAVGYDYDTLSYKIASWGSWSFDVADIPVLTPPLSFFSALVTVTNFNNVYFLAGLGYTGVTNTFIHKCYWNEFSSKWEPEPCYNLAAFDNYNDCNEFNELGIYSSWAMNDYAVFAGGTSLDEYGYPQYTILYYDGNSMTNCGVQSGFTGIFYKHDYYGMTVPASGDGIIYGIHGSDSGNI